MKFIWIMLFTLVSVVFVMSPIIHTYRHLSIALCSYSRSFCKVFCFAKNRHKLLLCKDLRSSRGGGVLSCRFLPVMYIKYVGVVYTQSSIYKYMYYPILSDHLPLSVFTARHKTHLYLVLLIFRNIFVPQCLHTFES